MSTVARFALAIGVAAIATTISPSIGRAGDANGHIGLVEVTAHDPQYGTGFVFVYPDATSGYSNPPPCSEPAASGRRFVFRTDTASGRHLLAIALTAKAGGLGVFIHGTGTCDPGAPHSETVNFIGAY